MMCLPIRPLATRTFTSPTSLVHHVYIAHHSHPSFTCYITSFTSLFIHMLHPIIYIPTLIPQEEEGGSKKICEEVILLPSFHKDRPAFIVHSGQTHLNFMYHSWACFIRRGAFVNKGEEEVRERGRDDVHVNSNNLSFFVSSSLPFSSSLPSSSFLSSLSITLTHIHQPRKITGVIHKT